MALLYTAARGIFFRITIYKYLKCRKYADNLNFYFDKQIIRVKYYHCCMCGIGTAPGGSFRSALVGSGTDATDDTSEMTLTSFS